MVVSSYNFFFHPFDQNHSSQAKILSMITNIALAIISRGFYVPIFAAIHLSERISKNSDSAQKQRIHDVVLAQSGGVDRKALKIKQKDHLSKLQTLADQGEWQALQEHTDHPDSAFDWWMFPIDRGSASFGQKYQLTKDDVEALKQDPEFIQSYRRGIILVAKSWGWDLENKLDVTNRRQHWTGYQVRLGKMIHSMRLFNQDDLLHNLINFIDQKGLHPSLESWIQKML